MTKASASPPQPGTPAIQTTRASSNEYDTPAEPAAAAAAPTEGQIPPPSTPDPQDECVICCHPFPLKENCNCYKTCCGELICNGCIIAQKRTLMIGTNVQKPIAGSKEEDLEFISMLTSPQNISCPFCRQPEHTNDKELLERLWNRIDEDKDPKAMNMMGVGYMDGDHGLSKNLKKAEELLKRSYDLGISSAAVNLCILHRDHVPDEARMAQYAEEGARGGDLNCINALAIRAAQSGNEEEAKRQFMTAARSGHEEAMQNLVVSYRNKLLSKEDLATTLRAHKAAKDKEKSEPREYAKRLKDFQKRKVSSGK